MSGKHVPVRSCIACRAARPKAELMRLVRAPDGQIALDATGRSAGRGAYVCRSEQCVEQAVRKGAAQRALGRRPSPQVEQEMRDAVAADRRGDAATR